MDRLEAMTLLVAAVEAGSLSAAGRKLGIPLPSVSRKIADLEAHLGARLLVRTTRKLTPTDAGAAYVEACRRLLGEVEETERAVKGEYTEPRGELTMTAPLVFGRLHVLPVVSAFLSRFPDITVRLVLTDRALDLVEDHVDLAVRISHLPDSDLVTARLGTVTRVVCGSPDFLAAHGTPRTLSDLAEIPCVTFSDLAAGPAWHFATPDRKAVQVVRVRSRLQVNTAEAALDAAAAGVGLTQVLSYQAAPLVSASRQVLVLRSFELDPVPVSVVHVGHGRLPLKLRAFLDFATPRIRASLGAVAPSA
ncbi:LysR family transcriptional regulator [Methylobacterium radiotolerans]|nr:LysR family transcriptional regulator [Methylobacterium radiotolerans]KTS45221.1 LysR family transcriptional regulator [Methylobacterium radiotolerans]